MIISSLLIKYYSWYVADPICSLIIASLIFTSALPLVKQAIDTLALRMPEEFASNRSELLERIEKIEGVYVCKEMQIWSLVDGRNFASAHLLISANANREKVQHEAEHMLRAAGTRDVALQFRKINEEFSPSAEETHGL